MNGTNRNGNVKAITGGNGYRIKTKIMALAVPVFVMFILFGYAQTALASGNFQTTEGVNIRENGSIDANSLGTVSRGDSVGVLEHNPAGWSKVQVGNIVGYIRSDYLKLVIGDTPATFTVSAAAGVNVRESASTSAKSLAALGPGESVSVISHEPAGWSKVQIGDKTGYIRSDFLKHPATAVQTAENTTSQTDGGSASNAVITQLRVLGDDVNMRDSASTSSTSKIIMTLKRDTIVDVLENTTNGWTKVVINDKTGYIRSDFLAPLQTDTPAASQTLYTIGNVNLRKSASTDSDTIRTLSKGTAVEVVSNSNGWYYVRQGGNDGYIRNDMLTTSPQGDPQVKYTSGDGINLRSKATTSSSIVRSLPRGTSVTVLSAEGDWSYVKVSDKTGYIRSDLLSDSAPEAGGPIAMMQTITGVNVRKGPGTNYDKITTLVGGSLVNVLAHESNGWSRVNLTSGTTGYIKSDYLTSSGARVELVTMNEIKHLLPYRQNIRAVDVRTGISFNIQIFSKGVHADYDFSTREDADAMFSTRGGVQSWAARPLWIYVGDRIFAAASHGKPHDANFINNGYNGHFCLHFHNTTNSNTRYRDDLRRAVQEAYDKRPR